MPLELTLNESRYCSVIRQKGTALRTVLASGDFCESDDPRQWLAHLTAIKHALGNLSNDLSFVATLLVKDYLNKRFGKINFDAAGKPQGAAGLDIETKTEDGRVIVGEVKTTRPYQQKNGFGAAQRKEMLKDLTRLASSAADHRFMFVIDEYAFCALCAKAYSSKAPGVELVNLTDGQHRILGSA